MLVNRFDKCWKAASGPLSTPCHIWQRSTRRGYGYLSVRGTAVRAHRFSYERSRRRRLRLGQFVLHRCDTPACVNPKHLYVGTQTKNMEDRKARNPFTGSRNPFAKLTESKVRQIHQRRRLGLTSELFEVSYETVKKICSGERWGHIHGY